MKPKPLVGISACLTGINVRYNGGNKLDLDLLNTLGKFMDFIPLCPEFECGMSIPREPMRLESHDGATRLMTIESKQDMTVKLEVWIEKKINELSLKNLCGFIFKSKSPSCGISSVAVYYPDEQIRKETGIFTKAFIRAFPALIVEEAENLRDQNNINTFIDNVLHSWKRTIKT